MNKYAFDKLPSLLLESVERYHLSHVPTGGFLRAVLANDLYEAVLRADEDNLELLPIIVCYINESLHPESIGSYFKCR